MCWMTYNTPELKVAQENIPVNKIVSVDKNGNIYSYYYKDFMYTIDKLYIGDLDSVLKIIGNNKAGTNVKYEVNKGFHSYSCENKFYYNNVSRTKLHIKLDFDDINICQAYPVNHTKIRNDKNYDCKIGILNCIIPKGSSYYINEFEEIVSDQIKPIYCYVL